MSEYTQPQTLLVTFGGFGGKRAVSFVELEPMLDLLERNLTRDARGEWEKCDCTNCKARQGAAAFLRQHGRLG